MDVTLFFSTYIFFLNASLREAGLYICASCFCNTAAFVIELMRCLFMSVYLKDKRYKGGGDISLSDTSVQ